MELVDLYTLYIEERQPQNFLTTGVLSMLLLICFGSLNTASSLRHPLAFLLLLLGSSGVSPLGRGNPELVLVLVKTSVEDLQYVYLALDGLHNSSVRIEEFNLLRQVVLLFLVDQVPLVENDNVGKLHLVHH